MNSAESILALNALATTGLGTGANNPLLVEDFDYLVISVAGATLPDLTVKFQGSILQAKPDFASAQSVANPWDYVQVRDYQNASSIDGDTGVVFAGTADVRQFRVNVDGLKWFAANVTARAAGSVSVLVKGFRIAGSGI